MVPRLLLLAAVLVPLWVGQAAETNPWSDASNLLIEDAHRGFTEALETKKGSLRENHFGMAITLLGKQPKTRGNIDESARILDELTSENADDDLGIASQYYRARIEEAHRFEPDLAKATAGYEALSEKYPQHWFGQMAVVRRAFIILYEGNGSDKEGRLASAERLEPLLIANPAARDFHLLLGLAYLRFKLYPDRALRHFLAADAAAVPRWGSRGNVYIRIAELARSLGQKDLAIDYYKRFIKDFARDQRIYLVQERLAELEAAPKIGTPVTAPAPAVTEATPAPVTPETAPTPVSP